MNSKVSVVMVTFNCKAVVRGTLESIIGQSLQEKEIIVIDGGSTDGTIDIINLYRDSVDVLISEPDRGVYDAMNKGIQRATGEWIIFINSGDCFYTTHVLEDVFNDNKNIDCDVLYGSTKIVTNDFEYILAPSPLETLSFQMPFCHQSTFVKTSIMKEYGYDLRYRISADYNFFYNCKRKNYRFKQINNVVSIYDQSGPSLSNQHVSLLKKEMRLVRGEKQSWLSDTFHTLLDIKQQLIMRCAPSFFKRRTMYLLKNNPLVKDLVVRY